MTIQIYSVPCQTVGKRMTFLERTSIDLSSKLSPTCGGNVNYYKSVHPIPTLPVRIPWQFSKQISKLSFQLSVQVYSLLGQIEREKTFFGGCKKGGHIVRLPQRAPGYHKTRKSLSFL